MIPLTVAAPSSTVAKSMSIVFTSGGFCVNRTHTSVAMPSMPSLPTNAPRRSYPAGSGSSPANVVTVPSGSTTWTARTWDAVTPSARQCGPPELFATLPPIEHVCWLLGSGAKCNPRWPSWFDRSKFSTPGCTQARRFGSSTRRTRSILVVAITTAPSSGTAPPARPVPDPRGTNGTPWRTAIRTQACTSTVLVGRQTTVVDPSMLEASWRYSDNSLGPVRTRSGPSAERRSSTSAFIYRFCLSTITRPESTGRPSTSS